MKLIAHRGNINGPNPSEENNPAYVDLAIDQGFDVELDLWIIEGTFYLGHDKPQYGVSLYWLNERKDKLWIHCKNIEAVEWFNSLYDTYNYFWHQEDTLTLTSKDYIWVYPGKQPVKNSIAVLPELYQEDIRHCIGVCSDYINRYKTNI